MKKEYVKPIIESEEFIANEYVAACWTLDCQNCDFLKEVYDDNNTYSAGTILSYETYNGYVPCTDSISKETVKVDSWEEFWNLVSDAISTKMSFLEFLDALFNGKELETNKPFHPVDVNPGHGVHPNASV